MSTTERQLKLMRTLSQRRYDTVSNLALEFGVTARTILRDIDEITPYIAVYCKRGRYDGGVYVDPNYRMDRAYMMPDEIAVLRKVRMLSALDARLSPEENETIDRIIQNYSAASECTNHDGK